MTIPHPAWRAWTAVAAAYLLVLQVLVTGIAGGAHAASFGLDPIATAMCGPSAHGAMVPPDDGALPPHQSLSCCVLGCSMFGPDAAPPPAAWNLVRHPVLVVADTVFAWPRAVRRSAHGASPGLPRAPPGTV
ncbi:hypothetical protein V5F32_12225 [Xanthobacter oligotrophicus]|uniref:DUF2946 domain-containing protein n=1 Tax=Xanthobacter oligotrophicus TaxID=2607286 RepID=A0ABW6ZYV6_9HYPH